MVDITTNNIHNALRDVMADASTPMLLRQRQLWHWLFVTIIGILTPPVIFAQQTPVPFSAEYKVTKGIMSVGTTKRSLQDKGNGYYTFESITTPGGVAKLFTSGKVVERSYWRWFDNKLIPQEYEYQNSGEQKRNVKLIFDWDQNQVTNIINGDPWTMEIEENTLDKLIYQLAIMYDLSDGIDQLFYKVADGGKTKTYDIKIAGEERLVTELGTFNTVKIIRTHKERTTIMWCAKELQFLPARIEQRKGDDGPITAELVDVNGLEINKTDNADTAPAP